MAVTDITATQWLAAAKHRRSVYGLKNTSVISDARIEEIIKEVLSFAPSSYNTQPDRITLITGEKHAQFWDAILQAAEPILKGAGEGVWEKMSGMFQAFKTAYGSVVFWERSETIIESGQQHPSAAHMFAQFGEHSSGMHQILIWTALELEGLGANLQHLQAIPPVETVIKKFCNVPDGYKLKAHLNFGDEAQAHPDVPAKLPYSETFTVIN